jgi:threonine/homoserine/homoserine lactone efflux protein
VLSIEVGNSVHVLAATLGLSAILLSSALAFTVVKYLGAAYLIYLGLRKLLAREEQPQASRIAPQSLRRIFSQGVVVATLNPKTALFFLAFLPQFVERSSGAVALQMFTLGGLFVTMACVTDGAYALLAGTVGHWLRDKRHFSRIERYFAGSVYIGLGMSTALTSAIKN